MAKDFRTNVEFNNAVTVLGNITASTGTSLLGVTTFRRTSGDPGIYIDAASGNYRLIWFTSNSLGRWSMYAGPGAETGGNVGSDFNISRYDDSGTYIDTPFAISRNTGRLTLGTIVNGTFSGNLTASAGTTTLGTTNTGGITIAAGTTSISPLKLTSGTLNTNPTAGVIEYDGNAFYGTTNTSASSRGVIPVNIFATNTTNVALSAVNTAQSIFAAADDAVAVAANTAYKFTLFFALSVSGTSTTAYAENFLFGGTAASVATFGYRIITQRNSTAITQPGQGANIFWSQSSSANLFAATASTAQYIITSMEGVIRTTSSGTLTPQIQFTATPQNTISASILANAYIELTPIGSSAVAGMTAWT